MAKRNTTFCGHWKSVTGSLIRAHFCGSSSRGLTFPNKSNIAGDRKFRWYITVHLQFLKARRRVIPFPNDRPHSSRCVSPSVFLGIWKGKRLRGKNPPRPSNYSCTVILFVASHRNDGHSPGNAWISWQLCCGFIPHQVSFSWLLVRFGALGFVVYLNLFFFDNQVFLSILLFSLVETCWLLLSWLIC